MTRLRRRWETRREPPSNAEVRAAEHVPPLVARVRMLQRSAGNAAVSRMLSPASGRGGARRVLARLIEALDYRSLAQRIHDALAAPTADEQAVYAALQQLGREPAAVASLASAYRSMFNDDLTGVLRGALSGSRLEYALQLVGGGSPEAAEHIGRTPSSAADFEHEADRIRAALERGGSQQAVFAVLRPLDRDPDLIDRLAAAYSARHGEELVAALTRELTGSPLQFALFLLRRGPSHGMEAVTAQVESMVGKEMTWMPWNNTFEAWAKAQSESAAPPLAPDTALNCFEMILFAAHRANMVSWQWIHDMYTAVVPPRDRAAQFQRALSRGARMRYTPNAPVGRQPVAGEIVFMAGMSHVALATGRLDVIGRAEVISFWPPPNTPFEPERTLDQIKLTTIEDLVTWWKANLVLAPPIEFAAPPWS